MLQSASTEDSLAPWRKEEIWMFALVVDDERSVRDALSRALRSEGYVVHLAASGGDALGFLADQAPDVIVLDIGMPGLDGLETCRLIRAKGDEVPVLMLTARSGVSDRVAGLDAGADDYLVKPFALEELLARLRALLRRHAAPAVSAESTALSYGGITLDPTHHSPLSTSPLTTLPRPLLRVDGSIRSWGWSAGNEVGVGVAVERGTVCFEDVSGGDCPVGRS